MKLIMCEKCHDVVKLTFKPRNCECGGSGGRYVDDLNAEVWGECFKLGFNNSSLNNALVQQRIVGDLPVKMAYGFGEVTKGRDFGAFVIPESAETMKRVEKPNV